MSLAKVLIEKGWREVITIEDNWWMDGSSGFNYIVKKILIWEEYEW